MIAAALLVIINLLLVFYTIRTPGIAFSYLFLFSTINNILLFDLGLIQIRYAFVFMILLLLFYHYKPKRSLKNFNFLVRSPIFWGVMLVLFIMAMNLFVFGNLSEKGYNKVYTFIGPVFFLFLAAAILIHSPYQLKEMSYGIIILGAVFFVVFYLIKDPANIRNTLQHGYRGDIEDPTINAITLARICGLIFIPSILYSVYGKFNYKRILSIVIAAMSGYWIIIAATRGVILSVVLVLGFYYMINFTAKKNIPVYLTLGCLIALIFLGVIDLSKLGVFDRFMELAQYDATAKTSTSVRYVGYWYAFDIFKNHPIFGIGASGYTDIYGRYPHSMFFELLSEFGLSGLTAFILIAFSGVYNSYKILKDDIFDYKIDSMVLIWLYYFFAVQTSGNITINRDFWVMSGVLIAVIHITKQIKESRKNTPRREKSLT